MAEWFVAREGETLGPYDVTTLRQMKRSGELSAEDLVWHESLGDWVAAAQVSALAQPDSILGDLAAAVDERELDARPNIPPDEGPFYPLGSSFSVCGSNWAGRIVASPRAVYIHKKKQLDVVRKKGLIGHMLAAALESNDATQTCMFSDLPDSVKAQFPGITFGPCIVVPKEALTMLRVPLINNAVWIISGKLEIQVQIMIFSNGAKKRALAELGLPVNQKIDTSQVAAIVPKTKPRYPMWLRVLLFVLAILLLLAVFAARMLRH